MVLVSVEQIAQVATIVSGSLTALALIIVGLVMFIKLINKAKQPNSDGGSKITIEEWLTIGKKLLPIVFKIIDLVSQDKSVKETVEPVKEEKKEEQPKVEPVEVQVHNAPKI